MKRVLSLCVAAAGALASLGATVKVDWSKDVGTIKPVNGVGQGPILGWNDFSMFRYLQEAGVPFVRYHDVGGAFGGARFVDIPNVFRDFDADENDPKSYDFGFTDSLVLATCRHGAYPWFRLGVTIENVSDKIHPYYIAPPKDFAKWARICEHIVAHYNEGWANGYRMGITYWEIWNEPEGPGPDFLKGHLWHGPFEEYLRLYDITSRHLKAKFPGIKVGGYGAIGFYVASNDDRESDEAKKWIWWDEKARQFLKFVRERKCPLDFFSFHSYSDGPERYAKEIAYARKLLDDNGFKGLETSLDEWHEGAWRLDRGTARHAAAQAAVLLTMQKSPLDSAMFYDARVGTSCYGGLFDPMTLKPLKAYWGFRAFNELKMRKNEVFSACAEPGVYVCAARGSEDGAVMVVNLNEKEVPFAPDFGGREILGVRMTDATRDFAPCAVPKELPPQSILLVTVKMAKPLKDEAGNLYLFRRGDRGIASYRIPAVATAKDGTLIAVCDERHVHAGDLHEMHPINIVCRRSTDNGKTWSPTKPTWVWPWTDPKKYKWDPHERWGASDPSLVADAESGKVFLLYNVMEHVKGQGKYLKYVQESSDSGLTWSKPRDITAAVGEAGFITSGRGCQLKDGTIVVVRTRPGKDCRIGTVVGSSDHGMTWRVLSADFQPADESKLAQLSDGSWYVNSRIGGKDLCRAVHVSKDRGKTWATRLDASLRDPHCNAAVLYAKGALWLTNCDSERRMNAVLRVSRDNGKTWKVVETLTAGPAAYSDLVNMDDGRLLLVWEDDRGSILCRPYEK